MSIADHFVCNRCFTRFNLDEPDINRFLNTLLGSKKSNPLSVR